MEAMDPSSRTHLEATRGWLELGNAAEAQRELERIAPELREHPDVLEVQWQILAKSQDWEACLGVAELLIARAPDRASGWITKSIALRGLNRPQAAWDTLLPVSDRFAHVTAIAYDLACYACRLGRLTEARHWLRRVFASEDAARWKAMAARDPDLEALRKEPGFGPE